MLHVLEFKEATKFKLEVRFVFQKAVCELCHLNLSRHAIALCPAGNIYCVPKETEAWHLATNYASHNLSRVYPNSHLYWLIVVWPPNLSAVVHHVQGLIAHAVCVHRASLR